MLASSIGTELFWAFRIKGRKPCRQKWRVNWLKISLEIFNFDKANVYQKGSFNGLICAFVKYARFFYLVYCGSLRPPPCSLLKYFKYFKCIVHCWRMYCTLLKNVCSIWRFQMHCTLLKNVLYTAEECMFNMKISNALYTAEECMFNMKITFKCFWTINFYICSDLFLWMKSEHLLKAMSGNKIHNSKVLFSLFLVKASK